MTENINTGGIIAPNKSTVGVEERVDAQTEEEIAGHYSKSLFKMRLATAAWWMLFVPVLFGRCLLVVIVIVATWLILKPLQSNDIKYRKIGILWVIIAGTIAVALVACGVLDALWYPVFWRIRDWRLILQIGKASIPLPLWFMLIRVFLIVAPTYAWDGSYRFLGKRFITEILYPSFSSVPPQQARASSMKPIRGATAEMRDPDSDPPPVVELQPARLVPYRVQQNAVRVPMLTTNTGDSVERDKVLDMIEAQRGNTGFAYDTWRVLGMTRTEWKTALALLVQLQLITTPMRGITTVLLTSVDDALDVIEGL